MKIVKKIGIIILVLVVIYVVLGVIGPSGYKITKSIKIAAPINVVFDQTSIYANWAGWSPWAKLDPTSKYTIENDNQEVGAKMGWVGNPDLVGTGEMVTSKIEKNKQFLYDLTFISPWQMVSHGGFNYTQEGDSVLLEWFDSGEFEFMSRPMMLFMDMEEQIGPSFEQGLADIKKICESNNSNTPSVEITEVEAEAKQILFVPVSTPLDSDSIGAKLGAAYGEIMTYAGENKLEMMGAPIAITTHFSMEESLWEFKAAIPFNEISEDLALTGRLEKEMSYAGKAVRATHVGPYSESPATYYALEDYFKNNGLEQGDAMWEEYIDDPMEVKEEELRTYIYFSIK